MLCEAVCGLAVEVEDGSVRGVRGDTDDPFSRGHICPKAAAIPDVQDDPDCLREPQRRVGNRWEAVSWKAALEEAGTRIAEVQRKYGRSAVGVYIGNPTVHSYSAFLAVPSRALGSRARFSATSVDQLPQMLAALQMFGHQFLLPIPDVDRTRFFLMLGANPLASNGSLMTAGGNLAAARRASRAGRQGGGGGFPADRDRRDGRPAPLHPPGSGRAPPPRRPPGHLRRASRQTRRRRRRSPAPARGRRTVSPGARRGPHRDPRDTIRTLARDFATAPAAVAYARVGASTQEFGALASWLVIALNAVTGNLDREGGFMFTTPAADIVGVSSRMNDRGHFGLWKSRVRGLPEFGGELPAATMAEEMETEGDGRIRALVTFAGNPVLSTPNGARLDRALAGLEYMVSIDVYRNETTRHANLILPTSFGFERDHYDVIFYALAVRNAARYVKALVPPPPGVRGDFEVLLDLALSILRHGGGRGGIRRTAAMRAARLLGERRLLDLLLRFGPHKLSLRKLLASPHGIDLGALRPQLAARMGKRRMQLAPEIYLRDLARLEPTLLRSADGLVLIGRRMLRETTPGCTTACAW